MLINTHPSLPNLASSKSAAMADEFNSSINWWDPSRTRFDNAAAAAASTAVVSSTAVDSSSAAADDHLHMMGLGLSSQAAAMDWNHALLRGEKGGDQHDHQQSSFRSMLQEDQQSLNYGGMGMWRDRSSTSSSYSSETTSLRGFSLEQPPLHDFCGGGGNGGGMFQAAGVLLGSDHHFDGRLTGSYAAAAAAYGGGNTTTSSSNNTAEFGIDLSSSSNWSSSSNNKVAQFLRSNNVSPPKPPQTTQLHFSNNAPFWNASAGMGGSEVRPPPATGGFFPTLHHHQQQQQQQQQQQHFPASSSFDEKPKNNSIAGEEGNSRAAVVKKSEGGGGGTAGKRSRNETTASTLPAFKVRKEKMGDRITALQQLVSPFGKTDTASVLSEAIEYIKFLHDQISVLSTPYMKSGAPIHLQQQSCDKKSKEKGEAQKDLRSRGLCLVPVSSTFPVTHETTVDFWTPTFGGTFR